MTPPGIDVAADGDPLALRTIHAFDARIFFAERCDMGAGPEGSAMFTTVGAGSTITGPLFSGRIVEASGGDWPVRRADGVVVLNAHYVIEHADGTRVYLNNRGYVHGPLEIAGEPVPGYFRCTPAFRAPDGPHAWINRKLLVGIGQRRPQTALGDPPDHSLFRYHLVL